MCSPKELKKHSGCTRDSVLTSARPQLAFVDQFVGQGKRNTNEKPSIEFPSAAICPWISYEECFAAQRSPLQTSQSCTACIAQDMFRSCKARYTDLKVSIPCGIPDFPSFEKNESEPADVVVSFVPWRSSSFGTLERMFSQHQPCANAIWDQTISV